MHQSKLLQLYKVLTSSDLTAFPKYAQRFSKALDKDAVQLFFYVKRFAPTYTSNRLRRAIICRHLFDGETIDTPKLRTITHRLKVLLEDFLIYKDIEEHPTLKQQLLLQSLKQRNASNYAKESEQLIQEIGNQAHLSLNEHLELFTLHNELWSDVNTEKISGDSSHFQKANEHLDLFYLQQKLNFILEYNSSKVIRQNDFKLAYVAPVILMIKEHSVLKEDLITKFWLAAIQMQQSNERADFMALKQLFFEQFALLPKTDAQDIFVLLNNFCNQHLKSDLNLYATESFLLYQFAIEKELLLINDRMRAVEYANIATVGFYAGQNEWTLSFLKKFKSKLSPLIRDAVFAQVYAFYFFLQAEFETAHTWILKAEKQPTSSLPTIIKIKTLKLRIIYEKWQKEQFQDEGLYQILESLVKSFVGYIKKQTKIPPDRLESYLTFARLFVQLIRLEVKSNSPLKISKYQNELDQNKNVMYKDWLTKKIKQMKVAYPT